MVGDRLLILVEAQSTWTVNIIIRSLIYLMTTYQDYFTRTKQNLYKSKKVKLPKPELYVIYTGDRKEHPEYLSEAVVYAYGVSQELLSHQENFFFGFYSGTRREFISYPVRNDGELKQVLREAYYEKPYETENLALRMYQDSGMQKGTLIQVTHEGVMDEA